VESATLDEYQEELSKTEKDDSWKLFPEKVPSWAGKPLQADEFDVNIFLSLYLFAPSLHHHFHLTLLSSFRPTLASI
jgi:hypothetical protein